MILLQNLLERLSGSNYLHLSNCFIAFHSYKVLTTAVKDLNDRIEIRVRKSLVGDDDKAKKKLKQKQLKKHNLFLQYRRQLKLNKLLLNQQYQHQML